MGGWGRRPLLPRPRSFETDRERSQMLAATSIRVSRATWRQLVDEPFVVIARLAQAIGAVAG
jgi:hypothetical protein